jgi:signal transduction histidine kinase
VGNLKNGKNQKFRTIFLRYICVIFVMIVVLALFMVIMFNRAFNSGVLLPANYVEKQIEEATPAIRESEKITPEMIPDLCEYAIFTKDGKYISGSLDEKEGQDALEMASNNVYSRGYSYRIVESKNQLCVFKYTIKMGFSSPELRSIFPNIEVIWIVATLSLFALIIAIISIRFEKLLDKKLLSVLEVTEKIQNQDLEFSVESTGVYEIDEVLDSIDKMKDALRESLQEQWNMEQERKDQILALAHDIKTPVTVIKGNAELLSIPDLPRESHDEFVNYILESTLQTEKYLKQLIEVSKMQEISSINLAEVDVEKFVDAVYENIKGIAVKKQIDVIQVRKNAIEQGDQTLSERLPSESSVDGSLVNENYIAERSRDKFFIDRDLISRAIVNIAGNAVAHTPENGKIEFKVELLVDYIRITISDTGNGFTKDDLRNATKQFYMGDASRISNEHHGMGLYITDMILAKHGGKLIIGNSDKYGGAEVIVEIPTFPIV